MHCNKATAMTSIEMAFSLDDELDSPTEESECEVIAFADDFEAEFDAIVLWRRKIER
jgi:hypothetical protein